MFKFCEYPVKILYVRFWKLIMNFIFQCEYVLTILPNLHLVNEIFVTGIITLIFTSLTRLNSINELIPHEQITNNNNNWTQSTKLGLRGHGLCAS